CGIDDDVGTHVCPFVFEGYIRCRFGKLQDQYRRREKADTLYSALCFRGEESIPTGISGIENDH
ncbi:MAG TPA: hypothetical protein O0X54_06440, partial [Methanocorpusculum sp.]|nr:hypothetical protein [Methanocorpusculum sp.]